MNCANFSGKGRKCLVAFFVLIFTFSFSPVQAHASSGFFEGIWCSVTDLFGFTCATPIEAVVPEPKVSEATPPPLQKPDDYQIVNSVSEVPAQNTTVIEEHNTYTTNPTTVIYQNSSSEITDSEFLDLFHKLTNLIGKTGQQGSSVSHDLFDKQIDKVFDRASENIDNVQEDISTLSTNITNSFTTDLLTVTGNTAIDGNATVGSDLVVTGSITAGVLNVAALSSAGALIAPYFTATSTTATNTFMGAVGIGTTMPSSKLTIAGDIDISAGSVYKYDGVNMAMASTTLGNYFSGGAGNLTMTGSNITGVGYQTFISNTSGVNNTGIGYQALYSNTTGSYNTVNGFRALYANTTGAFNTANGSSALRVNTTGSYNTGNGYAVLNTNTTGEANTANGYLSLYLNTTGSYNTGIGTEALRTNSTGSFNSAFGHQALYANINGSYNIALGYGSGHYLANGSTANASSSNSLFIGYDTRALTAGDTNQIVIGTSAIGNGSNSVTLGNTSITKTVLQGNVGIGTTTPSRSLHVVGVSDIMRLTNTSESGYVAQEFEAGATVKGRVYGFGSTYPTSGRFIANSFLLEGTGLGGLGISSASQHIRFYTGTTEKMIITSSGYIGIGTTTPTAKLTVTQSANSTVGGLWLSTSDNTDFRSQFMATSGVLSFYGGDTAGTLNTATLNAAGEWTNASDISYKENIEKLSYGLETVLALQPRSYDIKNTDNHRIGFIAQEVEEVIPEVVSGEDGSKGISYGNLVAVAINAIQELAQKVNGFAESITTKFISTESLDTNQLNSNQVETNALCIGQTCITEAELIKLLEKTKQSSVTPRAIVKSGV